MYLGNVNMTREDTLKVQEQFLPTGQCTTVGILLDGTDCKMHVDSGVFKSFISKQYYFRNKFLHDLTKLSSKAKVTQVENGTSVNILFIILSIIEII